MINARYFEDSHTQGLLKTQIDFELISNGDWAQVYFCHDPKNHCAPLSKSQFAKLIKPLPNDVQWTKMNDFEHKKTFSRKNYQDIVLKLVLKDQLPNCGRENLGFWVFILRLVKVYNYISWQW